MLKIVIELEKYLSYPNWKSNKYKYERKIKEAKTLNQKF